MEDNRSLVQSNRRYQLPALARYIATKELSETDDNGAKNLEHAIQHYLGETQHLTTYAELTAQYLKTEYANINNIVYSASILNHPELLESCIQLAEQVGRLDYAQGGNLLSHLTAPVEKASDNSMVLKLVRAIGNPYILVSPVSTPMFFGRKKLLAMIQGAFENDIIDKSRHFSYWREAHRQEFYPGLP